MTHGPNPYAEDPEFQQHKELMKYKSLMTGAGYGINPLSHLGSLRQPPTAEQMAAVAAKPKKSKLVAVLLAVFLGFFGAHNFYVGNTIVGALELIIAVIGIATLYIIVGGFILLALGIWVVFEIIWICISGLYYERRRINWK